MGLARIHDFFSLRHDLLSRNLHLIQAIHATLQLSKQLTTMASLGLGKQHNVTRKRRRRSRATEEKKNKQAENEIRFVHVRRHNFDVGAYS